MDILEYVYSITDSEDLKLYAMVNVALVLAGIRSGAIISNIPVIHQQELIERLSNIQIEAKRYPWGHESVVLLYNPKYEALRADYYAIQQLAHNAPTELRKQQDVHVGRVLGYYSPAPIQDIQRFKYMGRILVHINMNGELQRIELFPQRIGAITDEILKDLEKKAAQIRKLQLPEPFQIQTVDPMVALAPQLLGGGVSRHTPYKRKTRRRRRTAKSYA